MTKKIAGIDEDIVIAGVVVVGGYFLLKYIADSIGNAANTAANNITDSAAPLGTAIQNATGAGSDPSANMDLGMWLKNLIPGM